ncbi:MAG: hypothetical protein RI947_1307 [Candidatus Parcubacteria bacterium]|jgi:UDPglucose 6-dehydrogenase
MTITFIGHGYVGLVTACIFADFGNDVWVVGHTPAKIDRLKSGDPIIYEPGLKELLEKNLKANRIHFTLDFKEAVSVSDIVFITVGTPPMATGEADLSAVFKVAENIGKNLKDGFTVVSCKSTVPVGTNKKVYEILNKEKSAGATVAVASCPEFLREGTGLYDTLNPDRVVIGTESEEAVELLINLHKPLNGKRIITDLASAELIKYTANAMLATKISFANLISFYCEHTGADVETVLDAVGLDKRIGRIFLYPGVGYGGSCLPKDVKAILNTGKNYGFDVAYLEAVESVNKAARENLLQKILANSKGKKLAIWGLSFKPDTDDIREAPSTYILDALLKEGFELSVYDPAAMENIKKIYGDKLSFHSNPYDAVKDANGLCILTEWNEFKQADLKKVKSLLKDTIVFDGRNIYTLDQMKKLGFHYISTGRQPVV